MTISLITGANKGIGLETARQLVSLGHTVYLGARDASLGRAAADAIGARSVRLDVTDDASVNDAVAAIDEAEGRLDLLVHNAGVLPYGDVTAADAEQAFGVNAVGIVRVTEAALPLLRRGTRPQVVTVSSSAGSFWAVTNPDRVESTLPLVLYSASKAAASMLTLQYAKAHPGVRFNAVEPGPTATDMTAAFGIGRPAAESAAVVVRRAVADDDVTGTFSDEDGELAW